jgi:serine/threonine-protein kinase
MGEVYRARDTRLGREVAIKVLPTELAHDAERLARFEREARVLAALKHPNVATLHGFERAGDTGFLVMELIEGETLERRIGRGPIPWREAATLFEAIADGLKAAHEIGIVHRDLKPANVKIDEEGRPKVLDFGLARSTADDVAAMGALSHSPTLTAGATVPGVLLGTAAYMSPEQARGARVDRRADVWAFGVCLYEALTATRAFDAEDTSMVLAAILTREPDWQRLPAELPREIRALLRRCFEKDPKQRLQDLGDARWLLAEARRSPGEPSIPPVASPARRRAVAAAVLVGVAAVAAAAGWIASRAAEPRAAAADTAESVVRFQVVPPHLVNSESANFREFAVHPRGTAFAYSAGEIQLHDLASGESRPIPGASGTRPFFSSDGEWLGFVVPFENAVYKIPSSGGLRQRICTLGYGENPDGFAWRGDWIVFALREGPWRGLWKIGANGGERERLGNDPRLGTGKHPSFLPDRDVVLFSSRDDDASPAQRLRVVDLTTGTVADLGIEGRTPHYLDSGHLVFARDDGLRAASFDVEQMRVVGDAGPILEAPSPGPVAAFYSMSPQGTLVTLDPAWYDLVEIGLDGARRKLTEAPTWMHMARYSPDGAYVAYRRGGHGSSEIWIHEIATGRESKLAGSWCQVWPAWTAKNEVVYTDYSKPTFRVMLVPADRRGEPRVILEDDEWLVPSSVSPSGILLIETGQQIRRLDIAHPGSAEVWLNEPVHSPTFSPDGRWVAYFDPREFQVFVRPYSGTGGSRLASIMSGWHPTWSPDGGSIYFEGGAGGLDSVPVRVAGEELIVGASRVVLTEFPGEWARNYDTKPVGAGFVTSARRQDPSRFNVVLHFDRLIEQRHGAAVP